MNTYFQKNYRDIIEASSWTRGNELSNFDANLCPMPQNH